MKKKIKVSILKEKSSLEKFIKKDFFNERQKIENYNLIFNKITINANNKLINLLLDRETNDEISNKQSALVWKDIILDGQKRILIISIGDIRKIINSSELEENFGIKIGINYALKNNSRQLPFKEIVSRNKVTGNNLKEGKNSFTNLSNFYFKSTTDILKSIKMPGEFEGAKVMFNLNNFITFPIDENKDKNTIFNGIEKFIQKHFSKLYKTQGFDFLDQYIYVENELAEKLTTNMWEIIIDDPKTFSGIFVWPKFEEERHDYFTIGKSNEQLFMLDKDKVIEIINQEKIKSQNIKIHSKTTESNQVLESLLINKCIFFEYQYQNKQYVFHDGKWIQIEKEFSKKVDNDYNNLSNLIFDENLPTWSTTKIHEEQYNIELAEAKKWLLIDRELFYFDGMNRLELGDLAIISKNLLITVKNIHNSANMSHLVYQVKNAVKALRYAPQKIVKQWKEKFQENINIMEIKTYVVAIASKEKLPNNLPKLPFFAKLALLDLTQNVPFGFEIKIAWICIEK